ncbi:hypothetical protein BDZ91DRAFT_404492 [Kalaharituber pfeilii]|nr:hypothetical protein BDZ91DRAFT_404492 [Kalaharituber pfeilii]
MLIVKVNQFSLGQALKQCALAMKDMRSINGSGEVYGFVTTGKSWQMLKYDGNSSQFSKEMLVLFRKIGRDKKRWMDNNSVLADCMYTVFYNAGKKSQDLVVE